MKAGVDYAAMSDPDHNPNFRRTWAELRQVGDTAQEITEGAALKAIGRMLALATEATGDDREELFEAADEIRQAGGLAWDDILGKKAA